VSPQTHPAPTGGSRRAPHAWLADGSSPYDSFNFEWTLLALGPDAPDTRDFADAAAALGLDMQVVRQPSDTLLALYEAPLALIRPDQIVAWRGSHGRQLLTAPTTTGLIAAFPGPVWLVARFD